jgi:adenylosuccinate synthase
MAQIIATVDLGYGDSGKGTMIDALTRNKPTELVVRYSGGAQAAHNVVTPTLAHHTFAQFGSGTFVPGVKTYLGPEVLIDPHRLFVENGFLQRAGVNDALSRLTIDRKAPIITEFNGVINQTREFVRDAKRHGSCGMGIYETRLDSRSFGEHLLRAEDVLDLTVAKEKLLYLREEKKKVLFRDFPQYFGETIHPRAAAAYRIFTDDRFIDETLKIYEQLAKAVTFGDASIIADAVKTGKQILFEASQGTLLDETHGFLPYVTGSDVTLKPAFDLLGELNIHDNVYRLGIIRSYMSRHGAGPFVTEDPRLSHRIIEEHNSSSHQWQGVFRMGWFDPLAVRYAMRANGGVDGLAVTCLDQITPLSEYKYATAYVTEKGDELAEIPDMGSLSEAERIQRSEEMFMYTATYESCANSREDVLATIARTCGAPVSATSSGRTALDKEILF